MIGVSGAHGFIGSKLVTRLRQLGHRVATLDRSGGISRGIDCVYDLAAYGHLYGQNEIDQIYQANVARVAKELSHEHLRRFIFMSTSSVLLPQQTFYSLSKRAAEEMVQLWGEGKDKEATIVRPYTVYGPSGYEGHLIPKLLESCLRGVRIPFVPEPRHDFIFVDDVVDGLALLLDTPLSAAGIVEMGTGEQHSNQQVKEMVEKITGKPAKLDLVKSLRNYDTTNWVAQTSGLSYFGWKPKVSLEEGIRRMYETIVQKNS